MMFNLSESLSYYDGFPEERVFIQKCLELLQHPRAFERTHLPGHFTGSAWITNPDRSKVLLVHHGKLNQWMQPGGHADGEVDLHQVALREALEETGAIPLACEPVIFDLDIHTIPARKDFPQHEHYDVRFLLLTDDQLPVTVSDESHDVRWVPLDEMETYTQSRSVLRMKEKLFRAN